MSIQNLFQLYKHRYQSRRALRQLNESQLEDIGLTCKQALHECKRPFWIGRDVFVDISKQSCKVHSLPNIEKQMNDDKTQQHQLAA